jgi:hypothetical protein
MAVPVLYLAEMAGAVARRCGRLVQGRQASNTILTNGSFHREVIERSLAESGARRAADLRIKGSDTVDVALAEHPAVTLVTGDYEQLTHAAAVTDVRARRSEDRYRRRAQ